MSFGGGGEGGGECSSSSMAAVAVATASAAEAEERQLLKGKMAVHPLCEQLAAAHVGFLRVATQRSHGLTIPHFLPPRDGSPSPPCVIFFAHSAQANQSGKYTSISSPTVRSLSSLAGDAPGSPGRGHARWGV